MPLITENSDACPTVVAVVVVAVVWLAHRRSPCMPTEVTRMSTNVGACSLRCAFWLTEMPCCCSVHVVVIHRLPLLDISKWQHFGNIILQNRFCFCQCFCLLAWWWERTTLNCPKLAVRLCWALGEREREHEPVVHTKASCQWRGRWQTNDAIWPAASAAA